VVLSLPLVRARRFKEISSGAFFLRSGGLAARSGCAHTTAALCRKLALPWPDVADTDDYGMRSQACVDSRWRGHTRQLYEGRTFLWLYQIAYIPSVQTDYVVKPVGGTEGSFKKNIRRDIYCVASPLSCATACGAKEEYVCVLRHD